MNAPNNPIPTQQTPYSQPWSSAYTAHQSSTVISSTGVSFAFPPHHVLMCLPSYCTRRPHLFLHFSSHRLLACELPTQYPSCISGASILLHSVALCPANFSQLFPIVGHCAVQVVSRLCPGGVVFLPSLNPHIAVVSGWRCIPPLAQSTYPSSPNHRPPSSLYRRM